MVLVLPAKETPEDAAAAVEAAELLVTSRDLGSGSGSGSGAGAIGRRAAVPCLPLKNFAGSPCALLQYCCGTIGTGATSPAAAEFIVAGAPEKRASLRSAFACKVGELAERFTRPPRCLVA